MPKWLCLIGLILFFPIRILAQNSNLPLYNLCFEINIENHTIIGKEEIIFENTSNKNLSSLLLMLYPNRYSKKQTYLNEINFERFYPKRENFGNMKITELEINNEVYDAKFFAKNSETLEIPLKKELKSNEKIKLKIKWITKIPEQFGPFGYFEDQISLNGGFYPTINALNQKSEFNIKLIFSKKYDAIINGEFYSNTNEITKKLSDYYISIVLAKKFYLTKYQTKRSNFYYYQITKNENKIKNIKKILDNLSLNKKEIVIVDVPIREILTLNSENMLFISDKMFNIFFYFRYFHEFEFIRGLYIQSVRDEIQKIEKENEWFWINEAIGWYLCDLYRNFYNKQTQKPIDARDILLLRIFSFLPPIQEALYAPQFPFTYAYFNDIFYIDPFKSDIVTYKSEIPPGRVIAEKLKDTLKEGKYTQLFNEYILELSKNKNSSFIEISNKYLENSKEFWTQWLKKLPIQNYYIKDIKKVKHNKKFQNKITVMRDSKEKIVEPVQLYAKEWFGEKYYLEWDGRDNEHDFIFESKKKIRLVEIDPNKRLHETFLFDNRAPSRYMLIVEEINASLGFLNQEFDANIDLQIRSMYNPKYFYNFSGFVRPTGYGFSSGLGKQFGRLLDFLRLYHYADVTFFFQKLDENFVNVAVENESVTVAVDSGITTSIILGYWFGNLLSYKNPQSGWSFWTFLELSSPVILSDYKFYRTGINITKLTKIIHDHILALRGSFGTSGNEGVPEQRQFSLGGINNIKGLPQGGSDFVGKHRLLLSAEYRHPIISNLDISVFDIFRIRKIKGSIYLDTGRVASTVTDKRLILAEQLNDYSSTVSDLFNIEDYNSDVGYSLQFFFDALGVRETLLRFDVAKRLDHFTEELTPRFYLSLDQSF